MKKEMVFIKKVEVTDCWENGKLSLLDSNRQPAWVARINGLDPKYGLARQFINKSLAIPEGRCLCYVLSDGAYCWNEYSEQHYGIVENGKLYEISKLDMVNLFTE